MSLKNVCKYSFRDLVCASKSADKTDIDKYLSRLYALKQEDKNTEIKKLCEKAGWYFEDVVGDGDVVYTAFSPLKE